MKYLRDLSYIFNEVNTPDPRSVNQQFYSFKKAEETLLTSCGKNHVKL